MSWRRSKQTTRRDANEPELLKAAARCGLIWQQGEPLDGWCWHARTGWQPVEIKLPKGRLRPSQAIFIAQCEAMGAPYAVWRNVDDVLEFAKVRK